MTALQSTQLTIELDVGTDPIAGRILGSSPDWVEFTGWLGLVGALDRARGLPPRGEAATVAEASDGGDDS